MLRFSTLLIALSALAVFGCGKPSAPLSERLACAQVEGVDALLKRPKGDVILIDGDGSAAKAAEAIGCAAAGQGERVVWGFGADAERVAQFTTLIGAERRAGAFRAPAELSPWIASLQRYRHVGANVEVVALSGPAAKPADAKPRREPSEIIDRADGEARNDRLAGALGAARATLAPERMILLLAAPDGARAPVGLSGYTWRPLGARLPAQSSISLRAETSARPGVRVRLIPFEDLPARGAALRYDGVVEVGPPLQQSARAVREGAAGRARTL